MGRFQRSVRPVRRWCHDHIGRIISAVIPRVIKPSPVIDTAADVSAALFSAFAATECDEDKCESDEDLERGQESFHLNALL
jgi:hypothetical protein